MSERVRWVLIHSFNATMSDDGGYGLGEFEVAGYHNMKRKICRKDDPSRRRWGGMRRVSSAGVVFSTSLPNEDHHSTGPSGLSITRGGLSWLPAGYHREPDKTLPLSTGIRHYTNVPIPTSNISVCGLEPNHCSTNTQTQHKTLT
jgi:hypothetical protein